MPQAHQFLYNCYHDRGLGYGFSWAIASVVYSNAENRFGRKVELSSSIFTHPHLPSPGIGPESSTDRPGADKTGRGRPAA